MIRRKFGAYFFYSNYSVPFLKSGFLLKINITIAYRRPHTHCLCSYVLKLFPVLSTPTTVRSSMLLPLGLYAYCFLCLTYTSLASYPLSSPSDLCSIDTFSVTLSFTNIYNSETPCTPTLSMLFLQSTIWHMFYLFFIILSTRN